MYAKSGRLLGDHPDLSISQQFKLVKLSRSAFFYTPVRIDATTLRLMNTIGRVFSKYLFFGAPQIAVYLRRGDTIVGRHRVRRLMAKMGVEAIYKRPRIIQPYPQHLVYQYLSNTMHADFYFEVLKEAVDKFGRLEIINTDQKSQCCERLWRSLKQEATHLEQIVDGLQHGG